MNRVLRCFGIVVGAGAVVGSLGACGASGEKPGAGESVKPATQAQIDTYLRSTKKDVAALEKKLKGAYKKSHAFPASADGLIAVSAGNEIQTYKRENTGGAHVVRICVAHVEKQPDPNNTKKVIDEALASTNTSVGVYATGKFMKFKPGTSTGSSSECT